MQRRRGAFGQYFVQPALVETASRADRDKLRARLQVAPTIVATYLAASADGVQDVGSTGVRALAAGSLLPLPDGRGTRGSLPIMSAK